VSLTALEKRLFLPPARAAAESSAAYGESRPAATS